MLGEFVATFGAAGSLGAVTLSLELQLDAPTSATIDKTRAVRARRAGVKKFFGV